MHLKIDCKMDSLFEKHKRLISNLNTKFKRNFSDEIDWNDRLIGIKGTRGVGKTTLILQYIKDNFKISEECLYVSMDDLTFPFRNIIELAENFVKRGGRILFIDEIHKQSDWIIQLKNIYDYFQDLKVVFTGSSVLEIDHSKADLSRRLVLYNMRGLSFREFVQIETKQNYPVFKLDNILKNHQELTYDILQSLKPYKYFEHYLKFGYYPYYLENKNTYDIKLQQLINQVIEYDIAFLVNLDLEHYHKIRRFLQILSSYVPYKPNISNLAAELQISRASVTKYLHLLDKAEIITEIYHDTKKLKSLQKPEKIQLHHPNLMYALTPNAVEKGSIRESFFVNQLSYNHLVELSDYGDFKIDDTYIFEIGGRKKTYKQIAGLPDSYIVADDIEFGNGNKIPLWLFGFLY